MPAAADAQILIKNMTQLDKSFEKLTLKETVKLQIKLQEEKIDPKTINAAIYGAMVLIFEEVPYINSSKVDFKTVHFVALSMMKMIIGLSAGILRDTKDAMFDVTTQTVLDGKISVKVLNKMLKDKNIDSIAERVEDITFNVKRLLSI